MGILKHIRSKSKIKNNITEPNGDQAQNKGHATAVAWVPNPTAKYSQELLQRIFTFVCPHTCDEELVPLEESMSDWYGCLLCGYRDLARCAAVDRQWADAAQRLLYQCIEIGVVHYCYREDELAAKRRTKHGGTEDTSMTRLRLLMRTVRANPWLASQVHYLKLPRMAKQGAVADLARVVSVLPNLRYVDLPDGVYRDQASCMTLKNELYIRCPEIQRMTYQAGAEGSFLDLGLSNRWSNLKILDLEGVALEPAQLVSATASLLALQEMKLDNMSSLDDTLFTNDFAGLRLPPVHRLKLCSITSITTQALQTYLQRHDTREVLSQLTLVDTSVPLIDLHVLLAAAPHLQTLVVFASVSRPLLVHNLPPLASQSLQKLDFGVMDMESVQHTAQSPSQSFYRYICSSITSGQFPSLRALYALSADVPTFLMPPPRAPFATDGPSSSTPRLQRELRVFTKTVIEHDWEVTIISPPTRHNRRGSRTSTRPLSLYDDPDINAAVAFKPKDSVMVSNGWGGYLAVPSHERRPSKSKHDTDWMGT